MAIREGKWRCPYCSCVNRGVELACRGCGATRDKDVTFFLEEDAPEVEDEALLKLAQSGADWLCQFCQTSNRPERAHCIQCGAEKGSSPAREVRELRDEPPAGAAPARAGPPPAAAGRVKRGCGLGTALLLLLVTGFCAALGYFALRRSDETVTVAGFEWQRAVRLEALATVRETAWAGAVPPGARVVGRARAVHHSERVQTGTQRVKVGRKDLGNGFFEDVYEDRPLYRSRDVYAERVTYEVERWTPARAAEARGGDRQPRWPDVRLSANEREAGRSERYTVLLQGRKVYRLDLAESRWRALGEGQRLHAVVQGGSRVVALE